MNTREVLRRLNEERRTLAYGGSVLELLPLLTRIRSADGSHHSVIYSALTPENADATIAGEIEHYRRLAAGFEWKLFAHDQPADLRSRLEAQGFVPGPCEAVMVYELAQQGDWIDSTECDGVARIERVEQIADYRRAAEAIFSKNYEFTSTELAEAIRAGSTQHRGYVAYAGADPVSVGRLYTHPESWFAGLYGGGTIAAYRGRGFYRAVVAARARDAMTSGARYLVVDALPTSRPILERLGFVHLTDTWPCDWHP